MSSQKYVHKPLCVCVNQKSILYLYINYIYLYSYGKFQKDSCQIITSGCLSGEARREVSNFTFLKVYFKKSESYTSLSSLYVF